MLFRSFSLRCAFHAFVVGEYDRSLPTSNASSVVSGKVCANCPAIRMSVSRETDIKRLSVCVIASSMIHLVRFRLAWLTLKIARDGASEVDLEEGFRFRTGALSKQIKL